MLHEYHEHFGATFTEVQGREFVDHYGDPTAEFRALAESAGLIDLSGRDRLCLIGSDRHRFLHGQVTKNIRDLPIGQGCYAAIVNAKAKMEGDMYVYRLADELLLDLEPGVGPSLQARLDRYIIADDVSIVDVASHFGLWSVLGPQSANVLQALDTGLALPDQSLSIAKTHLPELGDLYCVRQDRGLGHGFDLLVPAAAMAAVGDKLMAAAQNVGGGMCGWRALETHRVLQGRPRYGQDMDISNLPPEAGLDKTAIDYNKGCYIGQEIIARIRTYGQVSKALRGLRLEDELKVLPSHGDKLLQDGKEVGSITSAAQSPVTGVKVALGYVRRECHALGTALLVRTREGDFKADIVNLPLASTVES